MIWQGIVGDPGERGTSGEKGKPVCIANESQWHENDASLLFDFDLHQYTNIANALFWRMCFFVWTCEN